MLWSAIRDGRVACLGADVVNNRDPALLSLFAGSVSCLARFLADVIPLCRDSLQFGRSLHRALVGVGQFF